MNAVRFVVFGEPVGKGRPRFLQTKNGAVASLMQLAMKSQNADIDQALLEQELPFGPDRSKPVHPKGKRKQSYSGAKGAIKGKANSGRYSQEGPRGIARKDDANHNSKPRMAEKHSSKAKKDDYNEPSYYGAAARRKAKISKGKPVARSNKR